MLHARALILDPVGLLLQVRCAAEAYSPVLDSCGPTGGSGVVVRTKSYTGVSRPLPWWFAPKRAVQSDHGVKQEEAVDCAGAAVAPQAESAHIHR